MTFIPETKKMLGIALRLLRWVMRMARRSHSEGPSYESITISGTQAIITFKNGSGELTTPDKYGYLRGFEIAGSDQKFYPAQAFIKNGEVVVQHEQVTKPVAVRYNWADDAIEGNLFNKAGFPAEPFRSDSWKSITEGVTFKI
jgi:sialate O-acetylesterase